MVATEVDRLVVAGILKSERRGRLRLVDADPALSYFAELRSMLLKTMGPAPRVRETLADVDGVEAAFVYGSWAARYHGEQGPPPRDVDLLVVGEPDLSELAARCRNLSREIGIEVQLTVRTPGEWDRAEDDAFLSEVKSRPLVRIV